MSPSPHHPQYTPRQPSSFISPPMPPLPPAPPSSIDRSRPTPTPRFFLHDRETYKGHSNSTASSPDIVQAPQPPPVSVPVPVGRSREVGPHGSSEMSRRSSVATSTSRSSNVSFYRQNDRRYERERGSRDEGLRSALRDYQVHAPPSHASSQSMMTSQSSFEWSFDHPPSANTNNPEHHHPHGGVGGDIHASHLRAGPPHAHPTRGTGSLLSLSHHDQGYGSEEMDALVEIHRVLYRGKEDLEVDHKVLKWDEQGKEVKRVVERWFEGDCVYDHPLLRITSRQSLLMHFILLHLLSTVYLPSITPSALLQHARTLTSTLRNRLLGVDQSHANTNISKLANVAKRQMLLPKEAAEEEEWLGLPLKQHARQDSSTDEESEDKGDDAAGWWRLWDVRADCKEIGEMECYDGYHLAMIEHVITLTLFPSVTKPRNPLGSISSRNSFASLPSAEGPIGAGGASGPSASFSRRLMACLATEFEGLLHWDLPISTMVQFNEVGKATHVRDMIDIRDAFETFVPFAKRIGWITRHITGMVTSRIGALALSFVPGGEALKKLAETAIVGERHIAQSDMVPVKEKMVSPIGLGFTSSHDDALSKFTRGNVTDASSTPTVVGPRSKSRSGTPGVGNGALNSLGLEGLSASVGPAPDAGLGLGVGSAPDVDISSGETQSL
nr:uncharacterized protein CI109_003389 [Kwoniella shandongensis]KAA5528101.1 hypothetical protein CI109_003389 [Kwoniella shandongensis]